MTGPKSGVEARCEPRRPLAV